MPDLARHRLPSRAATVLALALLVAVALPGAIPGAVAEPTVTILNNGPAANRVDLAILGDGYTAGELAKYHTDVLNVVDQMFAQEPFKEYKAYFNVHRIDVTSAQSGADHPERVPPVAVDTAFDATYNCNAIQRLICIDGSKASAVYEANLAPAQYDMRLVIVNDPEYGGSGGPVAVASTDASVVELVLHELGHSFGQLTDEYGGGGPTCDTSTEPTAANATAVTTRALIKWRSWIDAATPIPTTSKGPGVPGLYDGSAYCDTGLYRPTFNSKMRTVGFPFEQINTEQWVKRFYAFASPLDAVTPDVATVNHVPGGSQLFTASPLVPATHALSLSWELDGIVVGTAPSYTLVHNNVSTGTHLLRLVVRDTTPWVRNDPTSVLVETRSWTVNGPATGGGNYRPLVPARILDTRDGTGGFTGKIAPGGTVEMQIHGRGGVPVTGVGAVAMNVTVTQPTAAGFLTLHPAGTTRPLAANLNFVASQTVPNLVVAKVGAGGKVAIFNSAGSTHVIVDVAGWYTATPAGNDGRFQPLVPARLIDTRGGVRLGPGASLDLQVSGRGGVPAAGAAAAVFNVAVTGTTATSFLTAYPTGQPRPLAANLNYVAGNTVSNRAIVKLGTGGMVTFYNNAGSTDVVVDVNGWFTDASVAGTPGTSVPLVPARIVDTRNNTGVTGIRPAGSTVDVQVTGRGGVPTGGAGSVILNVTVTQPSADGFLTLFPSGTARPLASDLNFAAAETRPNLVVVKLGPDGKVSLYTSATAHVVVDVAGWST